MYVAIPYLLLSIADMLSYYEYLQHYGNGEEFVNTIFQQYDVITEDTNEPDITPNSSYSDLDDSMKLTVGDSEKFSIFCSNTEFINP